MKSLITLMTGAFAFGQVTAANAQLPVRLDSAQLARLATASRMKLDIGDTSAVVGRFLRVDRSSLTLRARVYHSVHNVSESDLTIPWERINTVWVQDQTHWRKGAIIGGLAGAAFAAAFLWSLPTGSDDYRVDKPGLAVAATAVSAAAIGALAGTLSIRWKQIWPD